MTTATTLSTTVRVVAAPTPAAPPVTRRPGQPRGSDPELLGFGLGALHHEMEGVRIAAQ